MLIVAGALTGGVAWSGNPLTLPFAFAFPALWAWSPSRAIAALVSAGYFLAASRGLPQGVANFYTTDLWPGLLLWIAASLAFVAVHAALWTSRSGGKRAARFGLAALLMAVPPFGIVGWAHPLTAAGVLLPGWGWFGLAAAATGLLAMTTRAWPATAIALGGIWIWSAASWTDPALPEGWKGVDLELGRSLGRDVGLEQHRDLIAMVKAAASERADVVILPESALGFWTPTVERLWRGELHGVDVTVVAGAAIVDAQGYDNVMVAISAGRAQVLYRERMPVPVSMWQPWLAWTGQGGGAETHFFANPAAMLDGRRVALLICYEQLIVWPILQSMLHSPEIVIATGNGWWTAGTSIVAIQKASAAAWARLFGVPLVSAFNL
ncbi:conjugal transfer protein TraB [Mesorhizobium sp. NBSH29]|uniref:conjugal transfer protein TraB n=1 Tax=Mesorhizobium sp. NBSH29 TaxID=2654249 RepID=UPI0021561996|nr:conjugal transfer protein TraB [Mesorhizobium sp. NBSH29]